MFLHSKEKLSTQMFSARDVVQLQSAHLAHMRPGVQSPGVLVIPAFWEVEAGGSRV